MQNVERVELDPNFPGLILVTDVAGQQIRYRMRDGLMYPGRPWTSTAPSGHTVVFFIPFPDGPPEVLSVKEP